MQFRNNQARNGIEVVLFDLGGVLVELTGVPVLLGWLNHSMDAEALWRYWLASPAVRRFELGQTTAKEFGAAMVRELDLPVTPDVFLEAFTQWPRGVYPGVEPLLESLRRSYRLACFSNNNELHWERICTGMGLGRYFEASFPSHLIGHLKPDRAAFEYVATALGCAPGRILFLDDNQVNVDGAFAVGMQARRTGGFPAVQLALAELGLM